MALGTRPVDTAWLAREAVRIAAILLAAFFLASVLAWLLGAPDVGAFDALADVLVPTVRYTGIVTAVLYALDRSRR
ncbi:hypothetical protein [Halomarina ordinaria]|uniref:Uncharacterized protein n=1 Tax=Halomarina ordinaria TaxID=3033939 RepID=A0ABD5UAF1_9EURY|nr:hypothetical protein [Halomarina sp. PSRA2]